MIKDGNFYRKGSKMDKTQFREGIGKLEKEFGKYSEAKRECFWVELKNRPGYCFNEVAFNLIATREKRPLLKAIMEEMSNVLKKHDHYSVTDTKPTNPDFPQAISQEELEEQMRRLRASVSGGSFTADLPYDLNKRGE